MQTDSALDWDLWRAIADQGWLGLHLPEDSEGMGLGVVELAIVAEELGRACLPGPWLELNWATTLLDQCDQEQRLPEIIDGRVIATVAHFEPEMGWSQDRDLLETSMGQGNQQLNGKKLLVAGASDAKLIVCSATTTTAGGDRELLILAIPHDATGLSVQKTSSMDQTRRYYECHFEQVEIEDSWILARGAKASRAWQAAERIAAVTTCADLVGTMQWMLEATVEYAKTRQQFDRPIGSFQAVQTKCADMLMLLESARSATWFAAWSLQENKSNATDAVAIAKAYVSDAAHQVGNLAIQAHGGIGFTWEHDLHLFYKRARANEFFLGDATLHKEHLAKSILDE